MGVIPATVVGVLVVVLAVAVVGICNRLVRLRNKAEEADRAVPEVDFGSRS